MINASQLANLCNVMPGTFPVTYYARNADESYPGSGVTVDKVEKRPLKRPDFANSSLGQDQFTVFHMWTSQLGGIVPKPGDKFTDPAGTTWIIQPEGVAGELLEQRWRLNCNPIIA